MQSKYAYTTQTALRAAFWQAHPHLSRRKIKGHGGTVHMYTADTRCAFAAWLDSLERGGLISRALAHHVRLWRSGPCHYDTSGT